MRDLKRTAYRELLAWKHRPNHKTLEISGARQAGKTYLVNKFADEQYAQKIYINLLELSGEIFLEHYRDIRKELKDGKRFQNPVKELLLRFEPDFTDSAKTVVIIDEIQESAEIYNRIREFTRYLESDFILTGSYLGRILNKEFRYSAGDITSLEIHTLSFEEFLDAFGKSEIFRELDIFGSGTEETYQQISFWYEIYRQIGGYPSVVLKYLSTSSIAECREELQEIIHLFTNESRRYFDDILDYEAYANLFCSIARVLVKEKKGFEAGSFSEELQKITAKDYSSNLVLHPARNHSCALPAPHYCGVKIPSRWNHIAVEILPCTSTNQTERNCNFWPDGVLGKASINRAIDWLYSSGIIGFAGKITNCNVLDFRAKARCYFMDLGLASLFLKQIGCEDSDINGIVNENFVYLDLKRRSGPLGELAFEMPAFATWGAGELDFYTKSLSTGKTYAIEVKSGKNSGKTAMDVLEKKKADYALMAKGNTYGGVKDKIYTIPVYGISKFRFS